jgi:3'-phosphoadenosine 5'-phosphosulfate sulfotransferase (PAPS reductase)/FAD synthetase
MATKRASGEWRKKLAGRLVIASISGGKDSAALGLWLQEQGIEHRRVFMDTGWEHPLTYEYLRGPLTKALGPIEELKPPLGMEELILKKGMFPSRVRRFCTQELKVFPMQRFLRTLDTEVINAVGIRAAESEARSKMEEWEWSEGFDCEIWRPLIRWSEQDVIDIHARHGLRPNPLYLQGASRVGCWPCIFARKAELRFLADTDPGRIDLMRELEKTVAEKAHARHEAQGLPRVKNDPTWFQAKTGGTGDCWPIDRVVQWSRTSRGGRQYELFTSTDADAGCMRWGLCDTGDTDNNKEEP